MKIKNNLKLLAVIGLLAGAAAYASAQPKPAPKAAPAPAPAAQAEAGACMGMKDCPLMKDGKRIQATAKVEKSARGAVIRIDAKADADIADVQRMAQMLAKHVEEGCPMMGEHGMHGHGGGMHGGMHGKHGGAHGAGPHAH
jgi:hypothetical protein